MRLELTPTCWLVGDLITHELALVMSPPNDINAIALTYPLCNILVSEMATILNSFLNSVIADRTAETRSRTALSFTKTSKVKIDLTYDRFGLLFDLTQMKIPSQIFITLDYPQAVKLNTFIKHILKDRPEF